jgi:integrase
LLITFVPVPLGRRSRRMAGPRRIDSLYIRLEKSLAPRTVHHVHTVLKACLKAAVRKGLPTSNPADRAEAPSPGETDVGMVLDAEQLGELMRGFRRSSLYPIVAIAGFTGARRGEILGLRWTDLDANAKTLRVERAIEDTKAYGRVLKEPKTARGRRTIQIDDALPKRLLAERERYLRVMAGVPDGTDVDLSLVKLPDDALMFPAPPGPGESICATSTPSPGVSFVRRANSASASSGSMIGVAATKRSCSTKGCRSMLWPRGAATIRQ